MSPCTTATENPFSAFFCSEEDVLGTLDDSETFAIPNEPELETSETQPTDEHLITLLTVTLQVRFPENQQQAVFGFFGKPFTLQMGRAEPRDSRGYFLAVEYDGKADRNRVWREAEPEETDEIAILSAISHTGETLEETAHAEVMKMKLRRLLSDVPVSALSDVMEMMQQAGLGDLVAKLHEATSDAEKGSDEE